jgi:hypothetical protein
MNEATRNRYFVAACFTAFAVALIAPAIVVILGKMFTNLKSDTTALSNASFVIMTLMATTSFTYAQMLEGRQRRKIIGSGERFFLGAIFFAVASLQKFALLEIIQGAKPEAMVNGLDILRDWLGIFSSTSFALAMIFTFGALFELSLFLVARYTGHENGDADVK